MVFDNLSVKVGDNVTVGLGTHDMEVKAWITFPELDLTHEIDLDSSPSLTQYKELPGGSKHYERMTVLSLHKPNHLKGQVKELRESGMGGILALVDLGGNRKRWFNLYLLNCKLL